jgi:hypothetical protein
MNGETNYQTIRIYEKVQQSELIQELLVKISSISSHY